MIDIQALISAVKASKKCSKDVLSNVLMLPSDIASIENKLVWADLNVPAAFITDEGQFNHYFFYIDPNSEKSPILPDKTEKPLISEMFYKFGMKEKLIAVNNHLTAVGFLLCAEFVRMTLDSAEIDEVSLPDGFTIAKTPDPARICNLWNHVIADKTSLPTAEECAALISEGLVFSIEYENELAAAMMLEKNGRRYTIRHVSVSPSYRRKGLAKALISKALSCIPEKSIILLWVEKNNTPAVKLYESMNFKIDGMMSNQWILKQNRTQGTGE